VFIIWTQNNPLKLIKTVFFLLKLVANMNLEDRMATSNNAQVGGNGTGHGGFGDLFGVLVSAVEVAASHQVGPHDPAAPTIMLDVPAVLDIPALPDSLPDVNPSLVTHPVHSPLPLQVPVVPLLVWLLPPGFGCSYCSCTSSSSGW